MMRAFIKPGLGVVLVFAVIIVLAFLSAMLFPTLCDDEGGAITPSKEGNYTLSVFSRKLLRRSLAIVPDRIVGEKCNKADIVINQGPSPPLPSGIPTYTVEITNVCATGCDISGIHLRCGWFSSARLINPMIFKRIRFNDCLVNDGKPLLNGDILSFEYANTFPYPLSVSTVACP